MPKCPDNTNCPSNTRCVQTGATKFECRGTGGTSQPLGSVYGTGKVQGGATGTGVRGLKLPKAPRATGSGSLTGGVSGTGQGSVELEKLPAGTSVLDSARQRIDDIMKGISGSFSGDNSNKAIMIAGVGIFSILAIYMLRKVI